jgi:hypothetical protein
VMLGQAEWWRPIPDWIGAIGTVAALGISLALLFRQLREFGHAEEDRERRGAVGVSGKIDVYAGGTYLVSVQNAGATSIFHCDVRIPPEESADPRAQTEPLVHFDLVEPQKPALKEITLPTEEKKPEGKAVQLEFTDSEGRRWIREANGSLRSQGKSPHLERRGSLKWVPGLLALFLLGGAVGLGVGTAIDQEPPSQRAFVIDGNGVLLCGKLDGTSSGAVILDGTQPNGVVSVLEVPHCDGIAVFVTDSNGVVLCGRTQTRPGGIVDLEDVIFHPPVKQIALAGGCPPGG